MVRCGTTRLIFFFEDYSLDIERRELRRGTDLIAAEPQVFDLLQYLISNRERVVSKDDLIAAVWKGRIVSESALTSRINAVRNALGDSGEQQRLIRTIARKGHRFVGEVREVRHGDPTKLAPRMEYEEATRPPALSLPDKSLDCDPTFPELER